MTLEEGVHGTMAGSRLSRGATYRVWAGLLLAAFLVAVGPGAAALAGPARSYPPIVVAIWSGPEHDNLVKTARVYEEKFGRQVIIEEIAREALRDKITTTLVSGSDAYDVIYIDTAWVPEYVQAGLLQPLDPFISDPQVADPGLNLAEKSTGLDALRVGGKIYGFPSEGDTAYLFYRADLLSQAGLGVPQTWDEYLQAALKMQAQRRAAGQRDFYGAVIGARVDEAAWDFTHFFHGHGARVLDEQMRPVVNSPEGVRALTFYSDLLNKHRVVPPDVASYGYSEILTTFQQGRAGLAVEWIAAWATIADPIQSPRIAGKWGYAKQPGYVKNGKILRGYGASQWGWAIPIWSGKKEAAYKFIEWLTSCEGAKIWALNGGIPTNLCALTDPEVLNKAPHFELLAEMFPDRHLLPLTTVTFELFTIFGEAANAAVTATRTPREALDEAAARMTEALKRAGYLR